MLRLDHVDLVMSCFTTILKLKIDLKEMFHKENPMQRLPSNNIAVLFSHSPDLSLSNLINAWMANWRARHGFRCNECHRANLLMKNGRNPFI